MGSSHLIFPYLMLSYLLLLFFYYLSRYLYYMGRVQAIQLEYSDSYQVRTILYCTVLYRIALCCTVLFYRMLHRCAEFHCSALVSDEDGPSSSILHRSVLFCHGLCCAVLYCTTMNCTVLHCPIMNCTVLHCPTMNCTVLHCPYYELYCTALSLS